MMVNIGKARWGSCYPTTDKTERLVQTPKLGRYCAEMMTYHVGRSVNPRF